jgi:hypothetical protein
MTTRFTSEHSQQLDFDGSCDVIDSLHDAIYDEFPSLKPSPGGTDDDGEIWTLQQIAVLCKDDTISVIVPGTADIDGITSFIQDYLTSR